MKRSKITILLLVFLNVSLLTTGSFFYTAHQDEKKIRKSVEAVVDRLADELIVVHQRLGNAQLEVEEMRTNLGVVTDEKNLLEAKLVERDSRIQEMKYELDQMRVKVASVNLGELVIGKQEAAYAPTAATTAAGPKVIPLSNYRQVSKAETKPLPIAQANKPEKTVHGSILAVNEDFNFVIVNLGSKDGIQKGTLLTLNRDGAPSGPMRVDMVDETTCAATIMAESSGGFQIGDPVRANLT